MGINVLSLFDGLSCGRIALERAGIEVDNYFSSEIDKYAIKIADKNYPQDSDKRLGDVTKIDITTLPKIDLLIGGSPCRNLSKIATQGGSDNWRMFKEGLKGDSALFFEYVDILKTMKPKYFLFENVVMKKESENIISELLGCKPILINSSSFSGQNRERLYWTNVPVNKEYEDNKTVINDILETKVDEKYFYKLPFKAEKSNTLAGRLEFPFNAHDIVNRVYKPTVKSPTLTSCRGGNLQKKVYIDGRVRKLTPLEYERLQTVPDNYTKGVSDSQRYNMLGDGWTVDVITHILRGLKV